MIPVGSGSTAHKRSGRYRIASLLERFGPDASTLDVLRHLTASCRHQRPLGAPPTRKYEHLCLAAITLPPPVKKIPLVPLGVPYTIEVWREDGGNVELHLATIYPLSMALAALEIACREWPTHEITLRDPARILPMRERPAPSANAAPAKARA